MRYVAAFLAAIFLRWLTLVALLLDGIGMIALAAANLGAFTVWWPLLAIIFLGIVVGASFLAFVEEAKKNEPIISLNVSPSDRYAEKTGDQYNPFPIVKLETVFGRKQLHLLAPFRLRVINHHPQNDTRLVIREVVWERRSLFRKTQELRRIPLVRAGQDSTSEIEMRIERASRSDEIELLFEDAWDGTLYDDVPHVSHLTLRPQVIGSPATEVPLSKIVNPLGLWLRIGRHQIDIRESIRTEKP